MSRVLRRGRERVRMGPWRGDERTAQLSTVPGALPPGRALVEEAVEQLLADGYDAVVTAALGPAEQRGFVDAGFAVREELHLLSHELVDLAPVPAGARLTRGRTRDRAAALAVDGLAFEAFWRLDEHGLEEALNATPSRRFRLAQAPGRAVPPVAGYAVTGRAGARGYLQRLAVHPEARGRGLGRALTLDGLHWLRRRGVARAMVNTQQGNDAAVALYRSVGFRFEPHGLAVLAARLGAPSATGPPASVPGPGS